MRARAIPGVPTSAMDAAGMVVRARQSRRRHLPELALAAFCLLNLAWVALWSGVEAFPVHFIFISVSVVFGLRMWTVRSSVVTLVAVSTPTFLLMVRSIQMGTESRTELVEVPLMALLFLVMVWHVHKRQLAVEHERALFANASHELMTPLTIAWGELELLGRDGVAADGRGVPGNPARRAGGTASRAGAGRRPPHALAVGHELQRPAEHDTDRLSARRGRATLESASRSARS